MLQDRRIDTIINECDVIEEAKIYSDTIWIALKELDTFIKIRFYRRPEDTRVWFEQSHFIHTPKQAGAYKTSQNVSDDVYSALRRAVRDLASYYRDAVAAGHSPSERWLEPNPRF